MDGKKLIEYICTRLDNKNLRLTDSNIVIELRAMNKNDLSLIIN